MSGRHGTSIANLQPIARFRVLVTFIAFNQECSASFEKGESNFDYLHFSFHFFQKNDCQCDKFVV
ncbi:hypothetical protein SAMN06295960_1848 [Paenibacillus aquistagni]|uniref:Uncharacterized protein n=1 Tax=Paenibacillus aquistagni TaxID=1852522 RepID=A0A1X7K088_9BACL|nr:hypothetical protein SAMN06295960_1848 [Paenibacillus aquistagni]